MSQTTNTSDPASPAPPVERVPYLILSDRYVDAVAFASTLHATQVRKGGDIAYISHLLGVSALVIEARGDEDQAIAGLLHDAAEDCGGEPVLAVIEKRFGARIAETVRGCSDSLSTDPLSKAPYEVRKKAYLQHLRTASEDVLIVCAADKLHNARSIWNDIHLHGPQILDERFNRPALISWYYRSVLAAIDGRAPEALTRPLAEVVVAMSELLDARYPTDPGRSAAVKA
jgi:hypothetical protein